STVQLGLDFLSPESLEQASKLAEEIRILPNDHVTKLQMISLYAASSAIKDVQKLVLDQKLGAELVFEDRNLTAMVSENLEKLIKQRQVACVNCSARNLLYLLGAGLSMVAGEGCKELVDGG
ncbi:hypothetical protein KSS87_014355, partial [Heliosperma pusillum]